MTVAAICLVVVLSKAYLDGREDHRDARHGVLIRTDALPLSIYIDSEYVCTIHDEETTIDLPEGQHTLVATHGNGRYERRFDARQVSHIRVLMNDLR